MRPRLDAKVIEEMRAALARYPGVAAAYVFGSVARGDADASSDLDVAVLLREGERSDDVASLETLAANLEPFSPSGRVDLVVLGAQGSVFRHRVLREAVLVYDADPARRIDFEARTIIEYLDWKPTHDIAMASVFEGLRDRLSRGAA